MSGDEDDTGSLEHDTESDGHTEDNDNSKIDVLPPIVAFQAPHIECRQSVLRVRKSRWVPVPVGPAIPRRDHPAVNEAYCRLMLIFMKPWRTLADLKSPKETWARAFHNFSGQMPDRLRKIVDNMQIPHECKDSRDDHYANRRKMMRGTAHLADSTVTQRLADNALDTFNEEEETEILETL